MLTIYAVENLQVFQQQVLPCRFLQGYISLATGFILQVTFDAGGKSAIKSVQWHT